MVRSSRLFGFGLSLGISLFLALVPTSSLWAGPVNNPRSYPFAVSNSQGDTLSAGDVKIVFQGRGIKPEDPDRSAATELASASRIFPLFTGGIAEPASWQAGQPFAIACSNRSIARLDPTRSPAFPGGKWQAVNLEMPSARYPLQCAMLIDGSYAWLDLDARSLRINDRVELALPYFQADMRLVAAGDRFWLLGGQSQIFTLQAEGSGWSWVNAGVQPFSSLSEDTRIVGNERLLLLNFQPKW